MLLSGGIDSATALYLTRTTHAVRAITFEYHGMAKQELRAARELAASAEVLEHRLVRLPDLKEAGDIAGARFGELPPTYIPLRNSIFYSYAASFGEEVRASMLVGGHNRDDEKVFHDVGTSFFRNLEAALRAGSPILRETGITIYRPLRARSKPEVIKLAASLKVPLGLTWSCHRDGSEPCWHCEGCLARRRAFIAAGMLDPLALKTGGKLLKR